jgi:hypothetical protein
MQVAAANDPIAAIRYQYRRRREDFLPIRVSRVLADAWQRHQERRIEHALRRLDHNGVWQDFRQACDR